MSTSSASYRPFLLLPLFEIPLSEVVRPDLVLFENARLLTISVLYITLQYFNRYAGVTAARLVITLLLALLAVASPPARHQGQRNFSREIPFIDVSGCTHKHTWAFARLLLTRFLLLSRINRHLILTVKNAEEINCENVYVNEIRKFDIALICRFNQTALSFFPTKLNIV